MENNSFTLTRTYPAPIEMVWKAITEREQMKQWYFDFADDFKLQKGATFFWEAGDNDNNKWMHKGEMLEIVENKRLVHSWEYPGYSGTSIVTWELTKVDENTTQLDFKHEFVVPFDPTQPAFKRENFVAGWNDILNIGLVDYLKK